jgi:hypothetical protein
LERAESSFEASQEGSGREIKGKTLLLKHFASNKLLQYGLFTPQIKL